MHFVARFTKHCIIYKAEKFFLNITIQFFYPTKKIKKKIKTFNLKIAPLYEIIYRGKGIIIVERS